MTKEPDPDPFLKAILAALLDRYEGAVILVKTKDDGFDVAAGVAGDKGTATHREEYQELVQTTCDACFLWGKKALADLDLETLPPREGVN